MDTISVTHAIVIKPEIKDEIDKLFDNEDKYNHCPTSDGDARYVKVESGLADEKILYDSLLSSCGYVKTDVGLKEQNGSLTPRTSEPENRLKWDGNQGSSSGTRAYTRDISLKSVGNDARQCEICKKSILPVSDKLKKDKKTQTCEKLHVCTFCQNGYKLSADQIRYMLMLTKERPFACKICHKTFTHLGGLIYHKLKHEEEPYCCNVCHETFKLNEDLTEHMITHGKQNAETQEKAHTCRICLKQYKNKSSLRRNMSYHRKERPHACKICGKRFIFASNLKRHMSSHPKKIYTCHICHKKFKSAVWLKAHITRHRKTQGQDRLHICNICKRGFKRAAGLKCHIMYTHTGKLRPKKPLGICEFCGGSFHFLKIHLRTHTGEKPHTCDRCGKGFSRPQSLKVHMLIHTGEKPHECRLCHRRFADGSSMRRHFRIHTGEKPYVCQICNKAFAQSGDLKTHMSTHRK